MNRNEKIIKLLQDNGFEKQKEDLYTKNIKISSRYRKGEEVKIYVYVDLDEDDMQYSEVEVNMEYSLDEDIFCAEYIIKELKNIRDELGKLFDNIDNCESDAENE